MLIPLGSDQIGRRRFPWASLTVAAAAVAAFAGSPFVTGASALRVEAQLDQVLTYWQDHPHLTLEPEIISRFVPAGLYHEVTERGRTRMASSLAPKPSLVRQQQAALDRESAAFWSLHRTQTSERFGLHAGRGWRQIGWLTYGMTHTTWLHLCLSLIAFVALAPFVEALYGRIGCLLFCLAAAIGGGAGYLYGYPESGFVLVGLESVAAGCGGLFLVRYGWRRVEIYGWIGIGGRPFELPALFWAIVPIACGLMIFDLLGPAAAFIPTAWLAAAGLGASVAILLLVSGVEARLSGPRQPAAKGGIVPDNEGLDAYRDLFQHFADVYDTLLEVARRALDDGDEDAAAIAVDRLLADLIAREDRPAIRRVVEELAGRVAIARLSPRVTIAVAEVSAGTDPWLADAAYQSLVDRGYAAPGAYLGAATLNLRRLARPSSAILWCERVLNLENTPADVRERAERLLAEARAETETWARLSRSERPRTSPTPVGEIEHCPEIGAGLRPVPEVALSGQNGAAIQTVEELDAATRGGDDSTDG